MRRCVILLVLLFSLSKATDNLEPSRTTTIATPMTAGHDNRQQSTTTLSETTTTTTAAAPTTITATPTTTTTATPTTATTATPRTATTATPTTAITATPTTTTTATPTTTITATPTTTTTATPTTAITATPTTAITATPTTAITATPTTTITATPTTTTTATPTTAITATPTTTVTVTPTATITVTPATATTATTTTTGTTSSSVTTPTGNTCKPGICGLAKCIALYSNYTCQCPYGYYYNDKRCDTGKTFPGVITLNEAYSDSVQNTGSEEYEIVYKKTKSFFQSAFKNLDNAKDFIETVIVEIQLQQNNRAANKMNVVVTNLFVQTTKVTNITVSTAVEKEVAVSPYVSEYEATSNCVAFACDPRTTECKDDNGFPECVCQSDFSKSKYDDRSCSECSDSCAAEEHEYCEIRKDGPKCQCLPNYYRDDGKCVACSVGFSGDNCTDNKELILIIVGTVLGGLVLTLIVAVSVVSLRAKHKQDPEEKNLINPGYSKSCTPDDRHTTMFPRVQTTSGHGNPAYQPSNPYEMSSTSRGRLPERDYDDVYRASRESEGYRMPRRY